MRRFYFALLALVLVFAAQPLVAATYYVGSCNGASYGSISAAVTAVPAGSTINVCPGTYAEQVVISKSLTLQGVVSGNSSQAVITVPGNGLATTSSINPALGSTIAAQVEVTAGPVNISNITVDGTATAGTNCPTTHIVGISYNGSSGTVNEVETRNQTCISGVGINVENGAGVLESVTIQNSNIHDSTYIGIVTCSDQTPSTLNTSIKSNYVAGGNNGIVAYCNARGSISGNFVTTSASGINSVFAGSPSTTVSGNTVTSSGGIRGITVYAATVVSGNTVSNPTGSYGILIWSPGGSVTSNRILDSPVGIYFYLAGATVKGNVITKANVGIDFNCLTGTVTGNTITGAVKGLDRVPAAFNGVNKFYDVATIRTGGGC